MRKIYNIKFGTNDIFEQQCILKKSYTDEMTENIGEANLLMETFVEFLKALTYSDEVIEKYIKVENIESF